MIPIDIQMQIDLMAADAKRAIAEGFAAARERLMPGPPPEWLAYNLAVQQSLAGVGRLFWCDDPNSYIALQQGLAADPRGLNWTQCNDAGMANTADPWGAYTDSYNLARALGL